MAGGRCWGCCTEGSAVLPSLGSQGYSTRRNQRCPWAKGALCMMSCCRGSPCCRDHGQRFSPAKHTRWEKQKEKSGKNSLPVLGAVWPRTGSQGEAGILNELDRSGCQSVGTAVRHPWDYSGQISGIKLGSRSPAMFCSPLYWTAQSCWPPISGHREVASDFVTVRHIAADWGPSERNLFSVSIKWGD